MLITWGDTDEILFGDSSTTSGFLPVRDSGEYRIIWDGYARLKDTRIKDGSLFANFILE